MSSTSVVEVYNIVLAILGDLLGCPVLLVLMPMIITIGLWGLVRLCINVGKGV